ncbi:hypothetical protein BX265_8137 [Streptomyces sp. TLI_235]|nr:hypothetical protein BX265_8137 [Streptomyces sp. TLI_235]
MHFGPRRVVFTGPGGSTEPHGQGHPVDVVEHTDTPGTEVKDGDLDMLLHFDTETSGLGTGDTEACVKGSYTDPADGRTYHFFGCRPVRVLPY